MPPKSSDSNTSDGVVIGNEGIGTRGSDGSVGIGTGIGGFEINSVGMVFDEEALAGLADFAADPLARAGRRVDRRRVTILI